jgi:ubiquinone/menaquinone biosynthesis C-methylase UbiE
MSQEMLKRVRVKFGNEPRACPVRVDAARLSLAPEGIDAIYWNAVYPHLEDRLAALQEAWRVLKSGGRLVISHIMGRSRVNESHRKAGGVLSHHMLPPAGHVCETVREAGFAVLDAVDEDRFYLVVAQKEIHS